MINLMDVLTEEINLELPMIKMANQDEVLSLKETIKFLENERTNLKKEIISINATLEQLKNVIENNKIEFQKKLEELQKKFEDNNTEINNKMEDNKAEINTKIENNSIEINNKIEEKNNLCKDKIREIEENTQKKENEILTSISENNQDIQGLKITQKYVNEKLICEEKEKDEQKENYQYKRTLNNFSMEMHIILYQKKILFNIKEIQDDLKSNPSIYENKFTLENLSQKTVHFKSLGNVPDIFKFLKDLLDNRKDTIEKKIIK